MTEGIGGGGPRPPVEDYQKRLEAYIKDIPPLGCGEIVSGTPAMPAPLSSDALKAAKDITTDPLFRKYTGWEHLGLLLKWKGDKTTTCNEFCSRCATAMGYVSEHGVGRFDIADWLSGRGLAHVWVPADGTAKPEYGDIFRLFDPEPDHNGMRLNHMAVSLDVVGTDWYTVESGQGGPSKGYDVICRRKRTWKPASLRGWISMRALLNAGQPIPHWLGGWWKVEEEPYDTWYYYFSAGGKVSCASKAPESITRPPLSSYLVGSFRMKGMYGLDISWQSDDVSESLTLVMQDPKKRKYVMDGKTARGLKLTATRLMTDYAFG